MRYTGYCPTCFARAKASNEQTVLVQLQVIVDRHGHRPRRSPSRLRLGRRFVHPCFLGDVDHPVQSGSSVVGGPGFTLERRCVRLGDPRTEGEQRIRSVGRQPSGVGACLTLGAPSASSCSTNSGVKSDASPFHASVNRPNCSFAIVPT